MNEKAAKRVRRLALAVYKGDSTFYVRKKKTGEIIAGGYRRYYLDLKLAHKMGVKHFKAAVSAVTSKSNQHEVKHKDTPTL